MNQQAKQSPDFLWWNNSSPILVLAGNPNFSSIIMKNMISLIYKNMHVVNLLTSCWSTICCLLWHQYEMFPFLLLSMKTEIQKNRMEENLHTQICLWSLSTLQTHFKFRVNSPDLSLWKNIFTYTILLGTQGVITCPVSGALIFRGLGSGTGSRERGHSLHCLGCLLGACAVVF